MDDIFKYTENKEFIKWVLTNDEKIDPYWENYIKSNPEEKERIDQARIIVLHLKSKNENIGKPEIESVFSGIKEGIEKNQEVKTIKFINKSFLKYASVVALILVFGLTFSLLKKRSEFISNIPKVLSQNIISLDNTQLILDSQKFTIKSKDSYIEFSINGEVVINREDTISLPGLSNKGLNHLIIPQGNIATVKLIDGSVIYLNAESQLIFPVALNGKKRQVYIVGEGFFEVKHDTEKPFLAITENYKIEVLGTKFNISAYSSDKFIETYLFEGKIKLIESGKLFNNELLMAPLQSAKFNKTKKELVLSDINDMDYISWYKGYLSFESKGLQEIIKKLERYYKVKIKIKNQDLGKMSISGKLKLKDENKDTVIQVLANTASLNIEKIDEFTYILKK
jgi:archaellum component FlaF (FlaF/FlaG flagellin family)